VLDVALVCVAGAVDVLREDREALFEPWRRVGDGERVGELLRVALVVGGVGLGLGGGKVRS
jgi:hypothetical protein